MKPRKHAELIKAWADGADIEYQHLPEHEWCDVPEPSWQGSGAYRIKPDPVVLYEITVTAITRTGENFMVGEFNTPPGEDLTREDWQERFSLSFYARKD